MDNRGFAIGDPLPLQWDDEAPKMLGGKETDFVNRRFFLLCIVNWDALKARGLNALSTRQPHAYYKLLMKSAEPANVPLQLSHSEYVALCDGKPLPEPAMPIADIEEPLAIENCESLPVPDSAPPPKRRRIIAQSLEEGDGSVSSSSSSSSTESTVVGSFAKKGTTVATGVYIGSKQVFLERHLSRGMRGGYCRLILPCAKHIGALSASGKQCQKKRNVNVSLGLQGVRESLAVLVAWARESHRDKHGVFQPTAPMRTFALNHCMHVVSGDIGRLVDMVSEF